MLFCYLVLPSYRIILSLLLSCSCLVSVLNLACSKVAFSFRTCRPTYRPLQLSATTPPAGAPAWWRDLNAEQSNLPSNSSTTAIHGRPSHHLLKDHLRHRLIFPPLPTMASVETAEEVILRPVPPLTQINGTRYVSNSSEVISLRFFHEWQSFKQDVLEASAPLDLSYPVPYTDDVSESYVVGSELGLTGRFSKNVCDPVSKVFATTCLPHLKFGDYQSSAGPTDTSQVPDITMFNTTGPPRPAAVGELKTFWTVELEDYSIREGYQRLIGIQHHIGKSS